MQEESSQRTVALIIRAAKLTEENLRKAILSYLRDLSNRKIPEKHGKMSVRDLVGKGQGADTMEINNGNIRDFDRVAAKYNIDYAVKKVKTKAEQKYLVFFKGRDKDVIAQAFKDFCGINEKKSRRPSVRQQLRKSRPIAAPALDMEKDREKKLSKDKEASL